jgi:SET domain-containing protein
MPSRPFRIGRSRTGLGLFAIKPIRRREYIATYRGRRLSDTEAARYEDRGAKYLFVVNKRCTIDGSPRWNLARYINHSCRPNAEAVGRNGGIVFIASRRIEPDEEITIDYGREYYLYFVDNGGCQCVPCRAKAARRRRKMAAARKLRQSRRRKKA